MTTAIIILASLALALSALLALALAAWRADNKALRWAEAATEHATVEAQKSTDREQITLARAELAEKRLTVSRAENLRLLNELREKIKSALATGTTADRIAIGLGVFAQGHPVDTTDNDHGDEDRTPTVRITATGPATTNGPESVAGRP